MIPALLGLLGGGGGGGLLGGLLGRGTTGLLSNLSKGFGSSPPPVPGGTAATKSLEAAEAASKNNALSNLGQQIGGLAGPAKASGMALSLLDAAFGTTAKTAKNLAGIVSFLPNQFTEVAGALLSVKDSFVGAFKALTDVIALPIDAVNELGAAMGRFVKLSNPGLFNRFTLVMDDAFASIGRTMEPALASLAVLARKVGDEFARLGPSLTNAFSSLTGLASAFGESLLPLFKELAPLINTQAAVWRVMAKALQAVGSPMAKFIGLLEKVGLLSKGRAGYDPDASSVGAAARQYSVVTSADEMQRDMAVKALSSGGPKTPDDAIIELPPILKLILDQITTLSTELTIDNFKRIATDTLLNLITTLQSLVPKPRDLVANSPLGQFADLLRHKMLG